MLNFKDEQELAKQMGEECGRWEGILGEETAWAKKWPGTRLLRLLNKIWDSD